MKDVKIEKTGDRLAAHTPYNTAFVRWAKQRNGKWNGDAWTFDARDEEAVREKCRELYGTDGTAPTPTVTVHIDAWHYLDGHEIEAFGRTLARRRYRNSIPQLYEGVVVVEGRFASSGGSRKNPRIEDGECKGVVLEVRDVPLPLVERELELDEKRRKRSKNPDTYKPVIRVVNEDDAETKEEAAREAFRSAVEQALNVLTPEEVLALTNDLC